MPFQVECMFCGHRAQVPDRAYGSSGRCPKCANSFTLVPAAVTVPLPARERRKRASRKSGTPAAHFPSSPTPAPPTAAAMQPPPPLLPPAPRVAVADRTPTLADFDLPDDEAPAGPPRQTHSVSFVAVAAVAAALWCTSSLALCGFVLPLGAASVVLGLIGLALGAAGARRLVPAGAAVAGGGVVLTALLWPALLGPAYRLSRQGASVDPRAIRVVPFAGGVATQDPEWVDASRAALQQGSLRVHVVGAVVAAEKKKSGAALFIRLRTHRGETPGRGDKNAPAAAKPALRLTDAAGKVYAAREVADPPAPSGQNPADGRRAGLFPVTVQEEVFAFEAPPPGAGPFRLEIPAAAWGGTGAFRFTVPGSMIRHDK